VTVSSRRVLAALRKPAKAMALVFAVAACSSNHAADTDGSAACEPQDAGCILCPGDQKWHCTAGVFAGCPDDAPDGGACGDAAPCLTCTPALMQQFACMGGNWTILSSTVTCTP
jgi:hypothetical protein